MKRSPYPHTDRELLRRLERAGGAITYRRLAGELGLGHARDRRLLVEQLTRMVARGELVRDKKGDGWLLPGDSEGLRPPAAYTPPNLRGNPRPRANSAASARSENRGSHTANAASTLASGKAATLISGKLDLHRDGFGFVRPDAEAQLAADIFIAPRELNGAMQGDLVLVDLAPPGRPGTDGQPRLSGRIARVLTRRNPTLVGRFHYAEKQGRQHDPAFGLVPPRGNFVRPFDDRMGAPVEIDGALPPWPAATGEDPPVENPHRTVGGEARSQHQPDPRWALEGLAVDVEITHFPAPGRLARGRIVEVLGHPDDFGIDVEIVIRKHHIPNRFPAAVLAEAEDRSAQIPGQIPALDTDAEIAREDFRELPVVTIDGETARDFDDAVYVTDLADGTSELQVHIADVSHYVTPGSALDTEARVRGTSVYFPDRAVPMLPHTLSSGICSLLAGEDRFVLSCVMRIDAEGEVLGFRVAEGIIRSARRCTYTTVQQCLDAAPQAPLGRPATGENDSTWNTVSNGVSSAEIPETSAIGSAAHHSTREISERAQSNSAERERLEATHPGLPAAFDRMLRLALKLNAKRRRRGSVDFDLPEPVIQFDPDGNMAAIVRSERGWAHRLIEEFMLSANECVAHWLERSGVPSIYRIHEVPDPKRIVEFEETAAQFGQSLGLGALPVQRLTMKADRRQQQNYSRQHSRGSRAPVQHELPKRIDVTPQMYQRLVAKISGHREERILAYLMLRSLKQARYSEQNVGHFALASPSYTHFTSPIRRYPDLIVHRLIRDLLRAGVAPQGGAIRSDDPQPWGLQPAAGSRQPAATQGTVALPAEIYSLDELRGISNESSAAERRASDAERELIEWKKMKFMEPKVGEDFSGMILSVTKHGFFVELDEMFIEGFVPLTSLGSLTGDHYAFRDGDRTIAGATSGQVFRAGMRVEVILDRIQRQERRLQFAIVPGSVAQGSTGIRKKKTVAEKSKPAKSKKNRARAKDHKKSKRRDR
jgi:ribonuclease R